MTYTNYELGPVVSVRYSPPNGAKTGPLAGCLSNKYRFQECYSIDGVRMFEPVDKNFPSSVPVPETDLKIQK